MAEKMTYHSTQIPSINVHRQAIDLDDDVTHSTNALALIFNLCNDIAKKIKDQAVDVIGHVAIDRGSKA